MQEIVAVDIGGTHARFAIARVDITGAISLTQPLTLRTRDFPSLEAAWERFRAHQGGALPDAVAMGVAALVQPDVIDFTNNPWILYPARIEQTLGCTRHVIVNDFEAIGHAVARAPAQDFLHLAGPQGDLPKQGVISVIGPGTGLGVAYLTREAGETVGGTKYRVQATEGSHGAFAPLDPVEEAIRARLLRRYDRVSTERVASGPGIVDIYQTLVEREGAQAGALDEVAIWQRGLSGEERLAVDAVERFCRVLGSVAGDLALAHGARAVVIAGGLGYRMREQLVQSGFASRFTDKGRYREHMGTLPVKIIAQEQPGLTGAAAAFLHAGAGD